MSITRLQQARQMYAMGQRVGRIAFGGGGSHSSQGGYQGQGDNKGGKAGGAGTGVDGQGGTGGRDGPSMKDIAGPVVQTPFHDAKLNYQEDRFKDIDEKTYNDLSNYRSTIQKSLQPGLPPGVKTGLNILSPFPFTGTIAEHFFNKNYDPFGYSKNKTTTPDEPGGEGGITTLPDMFDVAGPVVEEDITTVANDPDFEHRFRGLDRTRQDKQGQLDPAIMDMISKLYT